MSAAPIIYIAEPIDQDPEGHDVVLEVEVLMALEAAECSVYLPRMAWFVQGSPRKEIQQVNRAALARSQGLLAILPPGVPTIGVPIEIHHATLLGIPVAVLGGAESWALAPMNVQCFWPTDVAGAVGWLTRAIIDNPRAAGRRYASVIGEGAIPTQVYPDDVGWDLYYSDAVPIGLDPGRAVDVPCGVRIEWPEGMWAMIVGRSSTFKKGLLCNVGIIDPGYRGEYFAVLHNIGTLPAWIQPNERVAQAIPMHKDGWGMEMRRVERLTPSDRGERGFGSSGG